MATYAQRAQSMANAAINAAMPAATLDALEYAVHLDNTGMTSDPAWGTYTAAQKATALVNGTRAYYKSRMHRAKLTNAQTQATSETDVELAETP